MNLNDSLLSGLGIFLLKLRIKVEPQMLVISKMFSCFGKSAVVSTKSTGDKNITLLSEENKPNIGIAIWY